MFIQETLDQIPDRSFRACEQRPRQQKGTNIYIPDEETWAWAQYRAKTLDYETLSDYLFDLIKFDKQIILSKRNKCDSFDR